jgi:hypothetical protein
MGAEGNVILKLTLKNARFGVFTAVMLKIHVLLDMRQCRRELLAQRHSVTSQKTRLFYEYFKEMPY